MAKADCVFSTPPTNTSATRRHFLTIAAAGATALTLAPARAAAHHADPIFSRRSRHTRMPIQPWRPLPYWLPIKPARTAWRTMAARDC
jgi:hypothetical protein